MLPCLFLNPSSVGARRISGPESLDLPSDIAVKIVSMARGEKGGQSACEFIQTMCSINAVICDADFWEQVVVVLGINIGMKLGYETWKQFLLRWCGLHTSTLEREGQQIEGFDEVVVSYFAPDNNFTLRKIRTVHYKNKDGPFDKIFYYGNDPTVEIRYEIYEGEKNSERKVSAVFTGSRKEIFRGDPGFERKVRVEYLSGEVALFKGDKDEEYMTEKRNGEGQITYYEGPKDEERKVRTRVDAFQTEFYDGEKGSERLERVEFYSTNPDFKHTIYFKGSKGEEYKFKVEYPDLLQTIFFDGLRGREKKTRVEFSEGEERLSWFYEGERGSERVYKKELSDGRVAFLDGPQGREVITKVTFPEGHIAFYAGKIPNRERLSREMIKDEGSKIYEGPAGQERMVRYEDENGDEIYFDGPRGAERVVGRLYKDECVVYYTGPHGSERESRMEFKDNSVAFIGEEGLQRIEWSDGITSFFDANGSPIRHKDKDGNVVKNVRLEMFEGRMVTFWKRSDDNYNGDDEVELEFVYEQ